MDILTSSWFVLLKEWNDILGLLGIFLLGGGIVFLCLKTIFDDRLTFGEYFVLSAGGVLCPLFLGVGLVWLFNFIFGLKIHFIWGWLSIFVICGLVFYRSERHRFQSLLSRDKNGGERQIASLWTGVFSTLVLLLILGISIYLRLGFISGLIAPLYFDSAVHYTLVNELILRLEASTPALYDSLVEGYYHLGFHTLMAALSLALHLDVKDTILLFGQILVAILPLPLFFILKQETKLDSPGMFAILLAGWGWSMPAHALNWGKYPALTSLLAFEIILCCFYLWPKAPKPYRWILASLSGLCVVIATFIHTRSLVLIVVATLAFAFRLAWPRLPRLGQIISLCLASGGLLISIFVVRTSPLLTMAFMPYRDVGLWMIFFILLHIPLAMKQFPATTTAILLSMLFLLGSLFVPVIGLVPGYAHQTLLDRPFVEMSLSLPLSILGGLGYAALVRTLNNLKVFQGQWKLWVNTLVAVLFFGAFFINLAQYRFSPTDCCLFLGDEQAVALDWMDKNLPTDANILISAFETPVFEFQSASYNPSDGGVWITPLIHRKSILRDFQTDFGAQKTLDELCKEKVSHIFVGGKDESFDATQIQKRSDWYEMLLLLPKVGIYKIIGCRSDS